jgi:hypothetical protein
MAAAAPHQNDLAADIQKFLGGRCQLIAESDQHLSPALRRMFHQIENSHCAAVGKRKRKIGRCNHHDLLSLIPARKHRDIPAAERENLGFGERTGRFTAARTDVGNRAQGVQICV